MQKIDLKSATIKIYKNVGRAYLSVKEYDMPISIWGLGNKIKSKIDYDHLDIRSRILIYAQVTKEFYIHEIAKYLGYNYVYIRIILKELYENGYFERHRNSRNRLLYKFKEK